MDNNLNSIAIKNFKILKNTKPIKIKPITFLFGNNGSGKSTFSQGLFFLNNIVQNIKYDESNRYFSINKNYAFGTYDDVLNIKTKSKEIIFSFNFKKDNIKKILNLLLPISFKSGSAFEEKFPHNLYETPDELDVILYFTKETDDKVFLSKWELKDKSSGLYNKISLVDSLENEIKIGKFCFQEFDKKKSPHSEKDYELIKNLSKDELIEFNSKLDTIIKFIRYWGRTVLDPVGLDNEETDLGYFFPSKMTEEDKIIFYKIIKDKLNITHEELEEKEYFDGYDFYIDDILYPFYNLAYSLIVASFQQIFHSPHIRVEFPKVFFASDKRVSTEENSLVNTLIKIYEKRDENNSKFNLLQKIIKKIGFGDSLEIVENNGNYQAFLIKGNSKINIANASSGFKQVFPIMIRLLDIPNEADGPNRFFIIEQPELHLHPKLQSDLIDLIIENSKNINLIIETHSEHIIRKIQILVAKGLAKPEDIAVYYFEPLNDNAAVKELRLNEKGMFIDKWPHGFFDEAADLSLELLKEITKHSN